MLWDRLHGMTHQDLSSKYNLSEAGVKLELNKAKKAGLLKGIEERIIGELSNKALDLYTKALEDGDLFVAKDVLVHAAKIADRHDKKEQVQQGMSLQLWMQLRKERLLNEETAEGEVIDVQPTAAQIVGSQDGDVGTFQGLFEEDQESRGDGGAELDPDATRAVVFTKERQPRN